MDLFDKIEEYEQKVSENISKKLSIFLKITTDFDEYLTMETEMQQDLQLDRPQIEIFNEIKNTERIKSTIIEEGKLMKDIQRERKKERINEINAQRRKTTTIISNENENEEKEALRRSLSSSNFRNTTFLIFKTDIINYFDQSSFKPSKKFYSKKNELSILKSKIHFCMKKEIRLKLFSVLNERDNSGGARRKADKSKSKSKSREPSLVKDEGVNTNKINNLSRVSNATLNINHLIPRKKSKTEFLSTRIVFDRMFEFRYNGLLNKRLDIGKLKKQLKITKKRPQNKMNLKEDMKMTEKIIENYYLNRYSLIKSSKESLTSKPTTKNNKKNNDIMVDTTSNYYVKINRDRLDLDIDMRKSRKRTVEPFPNEENCTQTNKNSSFNPDRTFYNNITSRRAESKPSSEWSCKTYNTKPTNGKKGLTPIIRGERVLSSRVKIVN